MSDRQELEAQIRGNFSLGIPEKAPQPTKEVWANLDLGMYADAEVDEQYSVQKLAELDPQPDDIVVDTQIRAMKKFRVQDVTSNFGRRVADYASWMATLEVYLAKAGIRTLGPKQSQVRDFFGTDTSITTLFPAWVESQIIAGQLATGIVPQLIFDTEQVDSRKVDALVYNDMKREDDTNETLSEIIEGAELPRITLTTEDSTIHLKKYGGMLEVSYEAMAEQRLDVLGFWIRRIGQKIALDETDELLEILIGGDGTTWGAAESNTASSTATGDQDAAVGGTVAYNDMVDWGYLFKEPYELRTVVAKGTDLAAVAKLSEFKDPDLAVTYQRMRLWTPLGINYLRRDPCDDASHYETQLMVGVDDRYAAKKYTYGGFISEADKLINRQLNRRTFSYYCGFRKVDHWATICYDINSKL